MKYRIVVFLIIILNSYSFSKGEQSEIGLSFKLNKSLAILPLEEFTHNSSSDETFKLIDGTFGFTADLFFKSKRRSYYNLSLEYDFLSINDEFESLNNKDLSANYFKIQFNGISYMNPPDEFTPYFGYGFGLLFFNSNQDEVQYYNGSESEIIKGDLIAEFNLCLTFKTGLILPINEKVSVSGDIDIDFYFSQHLGLTPKLSIGGIYWLD